jgi:adenylate kinase family enzyme
MDLKMIYKINSESRILVVGTSGSGKSVFAKKLASFLKIPNIELDALFWEPNWVEATQPVFRDRILNATSQSTGWVINGNYNKVSNLTWQKADTLIWLDYKLSLVLWRVLKRSFIRVVTREVLWGTNRESFIKTFFTKYSIILWALQSYSRRNRQYENLIQSSEYAHLKTYRFKSPREAELFIKNLTSLN